MRRRTIAYSVLLTTISMTACKKVIDVDIRNVAPQIVIEGNITDAAGAYAVRISKTVNFNASNTYPPVTNATVVITDSTLNRTEQLRQADSGVYLTSTIIGIPHHTYGLQVTVDGQHYTASSTMPARVPLDSVTFAQNIGFNNQTEINAVVNFQDPPGLGNYYQLIEYDNGREIPNIFVFEDRLSDGRYIEEPLFNDSSYLKYGDTLVVIMNCIDKNSYNYYFTLMNVTGNNNFQSITPANPISNLSNGALGYFSAHTTQREAISVY